jgi:hypothetical protein
MSCTAIGLIGRFAARLDRPLGDRVVHDDWDGRVMPVSKRPFLPDDALRTWTSCQPAREQLAMYDRMDRQARTAMELRIALADKAEFLAHNVECLS